MRKFLYRRPWLYPRQQVAIFDALDHRGIPARYAFIEASTKAGKTAGCLAWLLEQAVQGKDGDNYWWVAPVYAQAKMAYRRMKRGLPKKTFGVHDTDLCITLFTGAKLWFKSAEKPDNLYGDDVKAAVLDEASRMREEAWFAIRSTLTATEGAMRAIGNVKGRKNWFFRLARTAEAGADDLSYSRLNAYDAVEGGVLSAKEIEDAKRLLPENVFKELYLAEASDDEGNPFGYSHIRKCLAPISEGKVVAAGVDLAKSEDWTVVIGLDREGRCAGFERWQRVPWGETTARVMDLVGGTPAYADSTGVGDPIVEALQRKSPLIFGYHFSPASKQRLMEGLAVAIQNGEITFPDGPIRLELEQFEYVYTRTGVRYSAPVGYHDDCVMALALAVARLREVLPRGAVGDYVGVPRVSPFVDALGSGIEHGETDYSGLETSGL